MTRSVLNMFGTSTVTIHETIRTPYGPQPGEGKAIPGCLVVETTRQVRDRSGSLVTSTAQVAMPPTTRLDPEEDTTVTLPDGRMARVLSVRRVTNPHAPALDHVEVILE